MHFTRLIALGVLVLILTGHAAAQIVPLGAGSYRITRPAACRPLPEDIWRTSECTGPVPTQQWWSSLVWEQFSQNLFAHPAVYRCTEQGLLMAYPGGRIHGNEHGIFGDADLQRGDLVLQNSVVEGFENARCDGHSDWFVTAVLAMGERSLITRFGHGSPYVFAETTGGRPQIQFAQTPGKWTSRDGAALGVTIHGHHYGIFGPSGSQWIDDGRGRLTNQGTDQRYFSVAVLPDDRPDTLAFFARYAHAHVMDTHIEYSVADGFVESTFRWTCAPREGDETGTLFALYPHQWKYTDAALTDWEYGSVRGRLKIGTGTEFRTLTPVWGVLPTLPAGGIVDRDQLRAELRRDAAVQRPAPADSYWEGKLLGTVTSLAGVAEALGEEETRAELMQFVQGRLENWLTAAPDEEQPLFYYDGNWGSLIGCPPSYGSDNPLNDHHFHYGYFIRAAAEVARYDRAWAERWGPAVELVIRDIASGDADDPMFPRLRCFDRYAGHSWASGDARFADGNNQESSSEALNAWYGIMLWGAATGNDELRDLGIALFNTERVAVEEYWLDVSGQNFPDDFPREALGMVWGGKGAFGTWFSADVDCIHGINWLPFTPASLYLGRQPEYVARNMQQVRSRRQAGDDFNAGWGDFVLMFEALHDPAPASAHLRQYPDCRIESGNSRTFFRHWVGTLQQLGRPAGDVRSGHPFAATFLRAGQRTYCAYNSLDTPLSVTFSDGYELSVPPRSHAEATVATGAAATAP